MGDGTARFFSQPDLSSALQTVCLQKWRASSEYSFVLKIPNPFICNRVLTGGVSYDLSSVSMNVNCHGPTCAFLVLRCPLFSTNYIHNTVHSWKRHSCRFRYELWSLNPFMIQLLENVHPISRKAMPSDLTSKHVVCAGQEKITPKSKITRVTSLQCEIRFALKLHSHVTVSCKSCVLLFCNICFVIIPVIKTNLQKYEYFKKDK